MNRLIPIACLLLASCGLSASQSDQIEKVLAQLGNTLTSDLQGQRAVALAATPPDTAGAQCAGTLPDPAVAGDLGTGALAVSAAIQRVALATAGKKVGALTMAEVGSLYQPGSPQFEWAVTTLESACIAKVHQINTALNTQIGVITAIPKVLVLAATAP